MSEAERMNLSPGARLADCLAAARPRILEAWSAAVGADTRIRSDRSLSHAEFVDHIPQILEEIGDRLRGEPAAAADRDVRREAGGHGVFRWRQGYDLAEVLRETAHLRQVLGDFVGGTCAAEPPAATRELLRVVMDVLDEGQVATVRTYVAERDRQIQEGLLERERARVEALEASARAKDDFLATLSHELRTPLTPILAWIAILERSSPSPAVSSAVRTIGRNARVLARLIDDLLDVSRVVAGKLDMASELVDLRAVVRAARDTVHPQAAEREVRLALHEPGGPLVVAGDATRLQQVVWNLLSNAVKFGPAGAEVRVDVVGKDGAAVVAVTDQGEGIEPAFLPHVFDRFSQQDQRFTRGHGGLGLGLAIARAITVAHGGRLTAASEGRGKGSRFELRLPLCGGGA